MGLESIFIHWGAGMAKRLTDTGKWANGAFRKLSDKNKLLYLYLLDNCDNAGIARIDLELLKFMLGHKFSLKEIEAEFQERIVFVSEDKVVIRNYIAFQNGDIIKSESRIAGSIRSTLNSHGLLERYSKGDFGTTNAAVALG